MRFLSYFLILRLVILPPPKSKINKLTIMTLYPFRLHYIKILVQIYKKNVENKNYLDKIKRKYFRILSSFCSIFCNIIRIEGIS